MKNIFLVCITTLLCQFVFSQTVTTTGSMKYGRVHHQVQVLQDGRVLAFGGDDGTVPGVDLASAELYNPATGQWSTTGSLHTARSIFGSAVLPNGKVLAIAGRTVDGNQGFETCELYDPATGVWTFTDPLPTGERSTFRAVILHDGRIFVAGGEGGNDSCVIFNPTTEKWSTTSPFIVNHSDNTTLTVMQNGKVLAAGNYGVDQSAEVYDPATGNWTLTANPTFFKRINHSATLLKNGKVMLIGCTFLNAGNTGSEYTCEFYDPATNRFDTSAHRTTFTVFMNDVVTTGNGKVLIWTLGITEKPLKVYNPATDSWTAVGPLGTGSVGGMFAQLQNGKVLVVGGMLNVATKSCWLIDGVGSPVNVDEVADNTIDINLLPNPGTNQIQLTGTGLQQVQQISIYNLQGQLVESVVPSVSAQLSTATLQPGMYLFCFYNDKNQLAGIKKWLKQ